MCSSDLKNGMLATYMPSCTCATIYRIKGYNELKTCLACQTQVQEGMYVASILFFPTDQRLYNI